MKEQAILDLVRPIVEQSGLEIDRVEVLGLGRQALVRISLDGDGPAGRGPSLDQITVASRAVSAALDASPAMGNRPYTLEVSSRGVSRPLTEPKHFRRNVSRLVKLDLAGAGTVLGRIVAVGEDAVDLDVDGVTRTIALAEVTRAVVQVELNRGTAAEELPDDDVPDDEQD